jgi:hypothetical protein
MPSSDQFLLPLPPPPSRKHHPLSPVLRHPPDHLCLQPCSLFSTRQPWDYCNSEHAGLYQASRLTQETPSSHDELCMVTGFAPTISPLSVYSSHCVLLAVPWSLYSFFRSSRILFFSRTRDKSKRLRALVLCIQEGHRPREQEVFAFHQGLWCWQRLWLALCALVCWEWA